MTTKLHREFNQKNSFLCFDDSYPLYNFLIQTSLKGIWNELNPHLNDPFFCCVYFRKEVSDPTMVLSFEIGEVLQLSKRNSFKKVTNEPNVQLLVQIESIQYNTSGRKAILELKIL